MDWDKVWHTLRMFNWAILAVLAAISSCLMDPRFTLGVILGGLMGIANFHLLQRGIKKSFSPGGTLKSGKGPILLKYYLRLAALGALIYGLMSQDWVHPVGLATGLSTVVVGIIATGIHLIRKTSSGEAI